MQTFTDKKETNIFLADMRRGLANQASWQGWYALDFTAAQPLAWTQQAKITALLRDIYPDANGSILWTPGGVLCVLKMGVHFDLSILAQRLYSLADAPRVALRLLCVDQERDQFRALIERHIDPLLPVESDRPGDYATLKALVPDIDRRLRNWRSVSPNRKGRTQPVIMVVDDDAAMLAVVTHMLRENYTVVAARNGREALEMHLREAPDIVFLDIGLPDCSGLALLNYMQQYDADCQIVMFTGDRYLRTQVRALAGGADGFVAKPVKQGDFDSHIARWSPSGAQAGQPAGG